MTETLQAGPVLDSLVANACEIAHLLHPSSVNRLGGQRFSPSTDLNDSMEAAEKVGLFNDPKEIERVAAGWVIRTPYYDFDTLGYEPTLPLAICSAILKVKA